MPKCFVVMGYGEKTDFATGRKLNLDATYKNVIKPAVEESGYECVRADEIRHSGVIDVPMYEMLYSAELVIADLSTTNPNAMFELGVRHALKPRSTIIIAENQFKNPFNISHMSIKDYVHLGPDIGVSEARRLHGVLVELIAAIRESKDPDSPVYTILNDLAPPARGTAKRGRTVAGAGRSAGAARVAGVGTGVAQDPALIATVSWDESYAGRLDHAAKSKAAGDWPRAKEILSEIYKSQSAAGNASNEARPRVVQELALATYKAGEKEAKARDKPKVAEAAYKEAIALLMELDPLHTTDPETLGLWAAIHKRRAEMESRKEADRRADLNTAIYALERGFLIRQDYYTGANLAYLLDRRASIGKGDDRTADRVLARRVRAKVIEFATAHLKTLEGTTGSGKARKGDAASVPVLPVRPSATLAEEKYWTLASLAEAQFGVGDPAWEKTFAKARALKPPPAAWMIESTEAQFAKLKALLKAK